MGSMLLYTLAIAAADSLNPFALSLQLALQSAVKKPRHIWFFILGVALANLAAGLLAFFGLVQPVLGAARALWQRFSGALQVAGAALGLCLLALSPLAAHRARRSSRKPCGQACAGFAGRGLSPGALVLTGATAALAECSTALPYFAFLALLCARHLSAPAAVCLLAVYNAVYAAPLMLLALLCTGARGGRAYFTAGERLSRAAPFAAPLLCAGGGALLVFFCLRR